MKLFLQLAWVGQLAKAKIAVQQILRDTKSGMRYIRLRNSYLKRSQHRFKFLKWRDRHHKQSTIKMAKQITSWSTHISQGNTWKIYLRKTDSEKAHIKHFSLECTHHEFEIIRLWEQPEEVFLRYPGLMPFAALADTEDPEATLRQVAQRVQQIPDPETQANISAASAILAGLRLDNDIILRSLGRDIMQESTMYQLILTEGGAKEKRSIAINLLRMGLTLSDIATAVGLSLEEVKKIQLSESL